MTQVSVGTAELLLIADEQVVGKHIDLAIKLAGRHIDRTSVVASGRVCTWPLQVEVPIYTSSTNAGSHLWYIAGYLHRNRDTVAAIRSLGCNLQLNLTGVSLTQPFAICASTLKMLGDLDIQLELRT